MAERIYVALDLETTGLDANRDKIIEIGAVRFQGQQILDRFSTLINPLRPIPLRIQQITGIRDADVAAAPPLPRVIPELLAFVRSDVAGLVAHNAGFDLGFLRAAGINLQRPALDTFDLAAILLPNQASYSLGELCRTLAVPLEDAHRALDDATATAQLFMRLLARLHTLPPATLSFIVEAGRNSDWPLWPLFSAAEQPHLPLFANAQLTAPNQGEEATLGLGAANSPARSLNLAKGTVLNEESTTYQTVPSAALTTFWAADGPLAQELGVHYEARPGQVAMANSVLNALNTGDHLLIEAGTGTGKSLAYLLPAALWCVPNQRRLVIATNTIALQDQLLQKDIPQVQALLTRSGQIAPQATLLKGRSNYLCTRRLANWRRQTRLGPAELSFLAKVLAWLPTTTTGDVSELFLPSAAERALWAQVCSDGATCSPQRCQTEPDATGEHFVDYFWQARQQAEIAHLLVVNHALLLADIATSGRILPPYSHLIVDEAHHLEEVATDQLTFRTDWRALIGQLKNLGAEEGLLGLVARRATQRQQSGVTTLVYNLLPLLRQAGQLVKEFADRLLQATLTLAGVRPTLGYAQRISLDSRVRTQPQWGQLEIEWDQAGQALALVAEQLAALVQSLDAGSWWQGEPAATLFGEVQASQEQIKQVLDQTNQIVFQPKGSSGLVTWLELNENTDVANLAAAPLYVNELLEKALVQQPRSAIFTSATLRTVSGFDFIRERLGLWDVKCATVESPFDYATSTLLIMPDNLPMPDQPNYQRAVEQAIIDAAQATGGRTLALFTSYAQVRTTAEAIRAPLDRQEITVLEHGTSSRNRLLREYRAAEKAVLLGTRSFWEGIDLPGDELQCLLIVRLPFAVPSDPLVAARSADLDDAFSDYTLPDAVLRFRQGFGRLIRRASDRGVVILLDSRVWQKEYGRAFLDALPLCTTRRVPLTNLADEVRKWLG